VWGKTEGLGQKKIDAILNVQKRENNNIQLTEESKEFMA